MKQEELQELQTNITEVSAFVKNIKTEMGRILSGQQKLVDRLLLAMISDGHVLLEGVPGLAKTLLVNTIGQALGLKFNRIQFTPDLMPSDIIGTEILDETRQFKFVKGPVFANIVLADEINRTPPKTQAALLEAMQEKGVFTHTVPKDLVLTGMNFGWEVPGTFDAGLEVRNMSIRIVKP